MSSKEKRIEQIHEKSATNPYFMGFVAIFDVKKYEILLYNETKKIKNQDVAPRTY